MKLTGWVQCGDVHSQLYQSPEVIYIITSAINNQMTENHVKCEKCNKKGIQCIYVRNVTDLTIHTDLCEDVSSVHQKFVLGFKYVLFRIV